MDVNGVELTAALNMTSSSDAAELLTEGMANVDRLAGEVDSSERADEVLAEAEDQAELCEPTPPVSMLPTSSSIEVPALLNKITSAEMEPLLVSMVTAEQLP